MEKLHYVSNDLRKAFPEDLKMYNNGEIVLKTNVLIWIKTENNKMLDFFGPIILNNHTPGKVLSQISDLLKESRIYVTQNWFTEIPEKVINPLNK